MLLLVGGCRTAAVALPGGAIVVAGPQVVPGASRPAPPRPERARCPVIGNCVPLYAFDEVVSEASAQRAITWIRAQREAGAQALVIKIDTPGGEVEAGFKLINTMRSVGIPTYCVVDDKAYSMGFAILQACTVRLATTHATLMIHAAALGLFDGERRPTGPSPVPPDADDARIIGVKAVSQVMAQHCAARMKVSLDEYLQRTSGDWWMNGREALGYGALDHVMVSVESVHRYVLAGLHLP